MVMISSHRVKEREKTNTKQQQYNNNNISPVNYEYYKIIKWVY